MSYFLISYFAIFLPIVILIYHFVPQKFKWIVLLVASYVFYIMFCGRLVIVLGAATLFCFYLGICIDNASNNKTLDKKAVKIKKKKLFVLGVLVFLAALLAFKYSNFVASNFVTLFNAFGADITFSPLNIVAPLGISYWTLQIISYLCDVKRGNIQVERHLGKFALYLSFFPQLMEGPISRYSQVADDLFAGHKITYRNLSFGYQRILFGLAKKFIIADRIAPIVTNVFDNYMNYDGTIVIFGILCFTLQLYAEFSGIMDIVIGSAEIFGVTEPENFRQPFFAKDASDFWHRWHITLGTWFKDYIFYPVSLAKPVKKLSKNVKNKIGKTAGKFTAPLIALFCVWSCNGLWHGPQWTYIFYGMYYFVIIFVENLIAEPSKKFANKFHIDRDNSRGYRVFRFIKLFIIVNIGEMFFRAATIGDGFLMLKQIFKSIDFKNFAAMVIRLNVEEIDIIIALIGLVVIIVFSASKEFLNRNMRVYISKWPEICRWLFWIAMILLVVLFGAYGPGYTMVEALYAGY